MTDKVNQMQIEPSFEQLTPVLFLTSFGNRSYQGS